MLVLVVGASGVGKDTLIEAAAQALRGDDKVWEQANQMRSRFGQKPLR